VQAPRLQGVWSSLIGGGTPCPPNVRGGLDEPVLPFGVLTRLGKAGPEPFTPAKTGICRQVTA